MRSVSRVFRKELRQTVELEYIASTPAGLDDGVKAPVILFLHGAGECGGDIEALRELPVPSMAEATPEFPFLVIAPLCQDDRWREEPLSHFVDHLIAAHDVDETRVYVTGYSLGGMGTWALAAQEPSRYAAIAPVCAPGIYRLGARRIAEAKLPTWVFHGEQDDVVPVAEAERMVEVLEQSAGDVRFTVYPEVKHDAWNEAYEDASLYEWFLSHRRR